MAVFGHRVIEEPKESPLTTESPQKKSIDPRWVLSRIPLVLLVGLFIAFAIQNSDTVHVRFLSWSFDAPRVVTLVGAAILGAVVRDLMRYRSKRRSDQVE